MLLGWGKVKLGDSPLPRLPNGWQWATFGPHQMRSATAPPEARVGEYSQVTGVRAATTFKRGRLAGVEYWVRRQSSSTVTSRSSMGKRSSPGRLQCGELRLEGGGSGGRRLRAPPPACPPGARVLVAVLRRILARRTRFSPGKATSTAVATGHLGLQLS